MDVETEMRIRLLYEVLCENNELTELSGQEIPFEDIPYGRKRDLVRMLKSVRSLVKLPDVMKSSAA